jgi:hypothetical protein
MAAAADAQRPLPVFELTEKGLRSWGSLIGGSPFMESFGFLLPAEPSVVQRPAFRNSHMVTVGSPVPAPIAAAGTGEVYALSS